MVTVVDQGDRSVDTACQSAESVSPSDADPRSGKRCRPLVGPPRRKTVRLRVGPGHFCHAGRQRPSSLGLAGGPEHRTPWRRRTQRRFGTGGSTPRIREHHRRQALLQRIRDVRQDHGKLRSCRFFSLLSGDGVRVSRETSTGDRLIFLRPGSWRRLIRGKWLRGRGMGRRGFRDRRRDNRA